jgi:hypothetical protein
LLRRAGKDHEAFIHFSPARIASWLPTFRLHEFRNRHVARRRQTAAVSLDALYLVERFSR